MVLTFNYLLIIVIKFGMRLTQLPSSVLSFISRPESTRINLENLKKIKVLIFYMKKLKKVYVNIDYTCCK